MAPEEVFRVIERDLPFYERSGGGVTLSGGEPLLQKDFAKELLTLCKEARISTAVETTGLVPWETFAELQGLVDLYLYDIKHLDPEVHKARTGRSNEQISENLKKLSATDAHIHVRDACDPRLQRYTGSPPGHRGLSGCPWNPGNALCFPSISTEAANSAPAACLIRWTAFRR